MAMAMAMVLTSTGAARWHLIELLLALEHGLFAQTAAQPEQGAQEADQTADKTNEVS
jgi:hypothetical protein